MVFARSRKQSSGETSQEDVARKQFYPISLEPHEASERRYGRTLRRARVGGHRRPDLQPWKAQTNFEEQRKEVGFQA